MVGTVCGLVVVGSTLWGTRHADSASAKSGTATALDIPLPFARIGRARDAPARIRPQQGRFAAFAAPAPRPSTTALSGFQDIVGPFGKRLVASPGLALEVAEDGARIDPEVLRRLGAIS